MHKLKTIALFISILTASLPLFSCEQGTPSHTHAWEYYVVKQADCTNRGLLEMLCKDCGEKEYEDIQPLGHSYQNGSCVYCGVTGSNTPLIEQVDMPTNANNSAMWSFSKIYESAKALGYPADYNTFMGDMSTKTILSLYLDTLGFIHLNASVTDLDNYKYEYELPFIVAKVSPKNQKVPLGTIQKINLIDSLVTITYTDGTQLDAGTLTTSSKQSINGIGINPDNELVIYYENGKIAFAGKISVGEPPKSSVSIVYRKIPGGYALGGVFDSEMTTFEIPVSHKGQPIIEIDDYAFEQCTNLKSIIIPATVEYINKDSFYNLNKNCVLYFEGKKEKYPSCYISNFECYFQNKENSSDSKQEWTGNY